MSKQEREAYYASILKKALEQGEGETIEFKANNKDIDLIGEYISALSNSGALNGDKTSYLIYGIDDKTHEVIGVDKPLSSLKVGNEEIESYLARLLSPKPDFKIIELSLEGKQVSLLEIPSSKYQPTSFKGNEYIRVGSYKKKLKEFPEKERELWRKFENVSLEEQFAIEDIEASSIAEFLDIAGFYDLLERPFPTSLNKIAYDLEEYQLIEKLPNGNYSIKNAGAILLAKDLTKFKSLANKSIRIIEYLNNNRINAKNETLWKKGYAIGYKDLVNLIKDKLPQQEIIAGAFREKKTMLPEVVIRESLANLFAHQDLSKRGGNCFVEIFPDRVEITSPGSLLIDKDRIVDSAPHSRNEIISSFLRLARIMEARGSGFDRIEDALASYHLPSVRIEGDEEYTRLIYSYRESFSKWSQSEKQWTLYMHTCLKYVNGESSSNKSIRERLGVEEKNKAIVSRIILSCLEEGRIKLYEENAGPKNRSYIPYWA